MSNTTVGMIVLAGGTILIIYQIVAYFYYVIAVYKVYSNSRKITKMPGLSFFFILFYIFNNVLFYPVSLAFLSFIAPVRANPSAGHVQKTELDVFGYNSAAHIVLDIVIVFIWTIHLAMQMLTALLTTELSTQRLVSWSTVEPYSRILFMIFKQIHVVLLTLIVRMLAYYHNRILNR